MLFWPKKLLEPKSQEDNNTTDYNRVPTDFVVPLIKLMITKGFLFVGPLIITIIIILTKTIGFLRIS